MILSPSTPLPDKRVLKIYISSASYESFKAIMNIKEYLKDLLGGYELKVINVTDHPEVAIKEGIIATPTLIKEYPPPQKRLIGDLSDRDMLLFGLGIHEI